MSKLYFWFCILPIYLIIQGNSIAWSESHSQGYITAQNGILFTHDTSGNKSRISTYNKELRIYNWDRGPILFFAGLTPGSVLYDASMTISDERNVGIGTTEPNRKLTINGLQGTYLNVKGNNGANEVLLGADSSGGIVSTYTNHDLQLRAGGNSTKITIKANGNVGIGTTNPGHLLEVNGSAAKPGGGSWSNSSDERLKNITGEYEGGLDEILKLRPVTFYYKDKNPRELPTGEENIGFIAQEVEEVFPEAISEGSDGYLDFNMHPVNVAVVNAIKELKIENDKLMAENEALRQRIEEIEAFLGI